MKFFNDQSHIMIESYSYQPKPTLEYNSMGYPINLKQLRRTTIVEKDTGRIYKFRYGLWIKVSK